MWLSQDLERTIAAGYADGRARFGDFGLDLAVYSARIKWIVGKNLGQPVTLGQPVILRQPVTNDETIAFVKKLHLCDLYLATACAQESPGFTNSGSTGSGSAGPGSTGSGSTSSGLTEDASRKILWTHSSLAWQALERAYKPFVRDLARFFSRQTFLASDLADNMLAELFLPDRSGNSRILSYDGRSSLCTWLRVVLSNRAINLRRGKAYARTDDLEGSIPERTTFVNFDQMVRAARYRDRLTDAMKQALAQLASQERLLLLWRYEDGLQLGQIARLLGIHPSNVGRRLQRLHAKLRGRIVANLATQHGLSGPAIAECLQDMIENPYHDVSILEALQSAELDLTSV